MGLKEAIDDLRKGKAIVVLDEKSRENEGDIVVAAEYCTAQWINFMAKYGRGLICIPVTKKRANELNLPKMVRQNKEYLGCNFTVSVDAKGCTTGISAAERALTVSKLINGTKNDFRKPGHMFPLVAHEDGLVRRRGHTEASVELMKLAGLYPAAVICEIMNDDGTMAREKELNEFCRKHKLEMVKIEEIAAR
ncbi:3,4-dihydroxy-2-butanone-4-phosphate synthase [Candidatus Woesearchaeota archaeon]|nr:3,4-dihydroxy-2-butanone-4-phosphate synthase [Candidatus Woesearchaeota archaeon]